MRTQKDYKESKQFAAASWICILIGVFLLAAYTVVCALDSVYNEVVGVILLTVYMAIVVAMLFVNRQHASGKKSSSKARRIYGAGTCRSLSVKVSEALMNVSNIFSDPLCYLSVEARCSVYDIIISRCKFRVKISG